MWNLAHYISLNHWTGYMLEFDLILDKVNVGSRLEFVDL